MYIYELPAIVEANAPQGLFTVLASRSFIHPHKQAARDVLQTGVILKDEAPFLEMARPMTPYERDAYEAAKRRMAMPDPIIEVLVVPTVDIFVVTFGPYLVLDELTFSERHLTSILAHQFAHFLNGDSFVRAALYLLGKGWFEEHVNPFGLNREDSEAKRRRIQQNFTDVARGTLIAGVKGVAVTTGLKVIQGVGSSVLDFEPQINQFFQRWDLMADVVAEQYIPRYEYQAWLSDLVRYGDSEMFAATPRVRLEYSESHAPQIIPASPQIDVPDPAWKTGGKCVMYIGIAIVFWVLFILFMILWG